MSRIEGGLDPWEDPVGAVRWSPTEASLAAAGLLVRFPQPEDLSRAIARNAFFPRARRRRVASVCDCGFPILLVLPWSALL